MGKQKKQINPESIKKIKLDKIKKLNQEKMESVENSTDVLK